MAQAPSRQQLPYIRVWAGAALALGLAVASTACNLLNQGSTSPSTAMTETFAGALAVNGSIAGGTCFSSETRPIKRTV
jgi:hypothetical protein